MNTQLTTERKSAATNAISAYPGLVLPPKLRRSSKRCTVLL